MIDKALLNKLTEAVWERQAADIAQGRGLLKSSLEEALAGVLALHGGQEKPRDVVTIKKGETVTEKKADRCPDTALLDWWRQSNKLYQKKQDQAFIDAMIYGVGT